MAKVFSRLRSQFFTRRTDPKPVNNLCVNSHSILFVGKSNLLTYMYNQFVQDSTEALYCATGIAVFSKLLK